LITTRHTRQGRRGADEGRCGGFSPRQQLRERRPSAVRQRGDQHNHGAAAYELTERVEEVEPPPPAWLEVGVGDFEGASDTAMLVAKEGGEAGAVVSLEAQEATFLARSTA
jgi:hypothetical protein